MTTGPTIETIYGILSKNLIVGAEFDDNWPMASNHITGKYRSSGTFFINLKNRYFLYEFCNKEIFYLKNKMYKSLRNICIGMNSHIDL